VSDLSAKFEHCLDEHTGILRDCEIEHVTGGTLPAVQKIRAIARTSIQDGTSNTVLTFEQAR
jgi:hypothetical protein